MTVNSLPFLIFFVTLFLVYFLIPKKNLKLQNGVLLMASYVFYGITDVRTLPILFLLTITFYTLGWMIVFAGSERARTWIMRSGVCIGLGVLVYFKYLNFFIDSFADLFRMLGLGAHPKMLQVILPLGLSFFIFRLISYLIDVQRRKIQAERDFFAFANFVAFFPSLLSGPIDRPGNFLPQLAQFRSFDMPLAVDGMRQILWGIFKKMVIANNLAVFVEGMWATPSAAGVPGMWLAVLLYPLQMYADFSAYTDMSIGVAKILGIRIAINFNYPFFAGNIAEYWRRWHISLTSWLTDYVFTPLSIRFRDAGNRGLIAAILITFVLIGFWHGARWTFGLFGLYHGLLYIPLILNGSFFKRSKLKADGLWGMPSGKALRAMLTTYLLVAAGLILFRADSFYNVGEVLQNMFALQAESLHLPSNHLLTYLLPAVPAVCLMLVAEWRQRQKEYALQIEDLAAWKRRTLYALLILLIFVFRGESGSFIYFQF